MSNNSSTQPGWLTPLGVDPEYDDALDHLLCQWLQWVTGYHDGAVHSRCQNPSSTQTMVDPDGCICGVIDLAVDGSPTFTGQTDDSSQLCRHEVITCKASFYGPSGMRHASRFRDGICIEQNNTELNNLGLSLVDYSSIVPFPEFINTEQLRRYDLTVRLRRKVVREYRIKSLVDAPVTFFGD